MEIAIGLPSVYLTTLTLDTQPLADDTLTVGDRTYTFVEDGQAIEDLQISIGTDLTTAQANIVSAINGTDAHNLTHPSTTALEFIDNQSLFYAEQSGVATTEVFASGSNVFEDTTLVQAQQDMTDPEVVRVQLTATQANIVAAINGTDGYNNVHQQVSATTFINNCPHFPPTNPALQPRFPWPLQLQMASMLTRYHLQFPRHYAGC